MSKKNKLQILVVGANGSLGSFLSSYFKSDKYCRDSNLKDFIDKTYDVIIYCASNTKNLKNNQLIGYVYDNYELLREILNIKHKYLIYFSSVDVYPKFLEIYSEDQEIDIRDLSTPYGLFKLLSEELIKSTQKNNYAILRPTMMISFESAKNNLKKIIEDEHPKLSVSEDSEYNVVLYSDVLKLVENFINTRQNGVFNIASSQNIKLSDLASKLNKKITWGEYLYKLKKIDTTKISLVSKIFCKTSEEVIFDLYKLK